ncbi:MAG: SHOCT domain-containing protein [Chloroflexi bacterium]|nr:SHOCT domain-containing protein [Chloroflexota bacterium]
MMGGFGMGGLGGFGMLLGGGFSLLLLVGLVFLVVWGIGQFTRSAPQVSPAGSSGALETLKTRYVRGEITKAEYDQMKADLT